MFKKIVNKLYSKITLSILMYGLVFAGTIFNTISAHNDNSPADFIFKNGKIYTVNAEQPIAEAVAVKGKNIVYVGSEKGLAPFIDQTTRIIDLEGNMLMPGFVDAHIHPIAGTFITAGVDLQISNKQALLERLKEYEKQTGNDKVITGFGWRYSTFPDSGPTKQDLDAIWPNKPVVLQAIDAHSAWVNSKALELANITKETTDPAPGFSYFAKDKQGEPTGYVIELPAVSKITDVLVSENNNNEYELVAETFLKLSAEGITTVFDAAAGFSPEQDNESYGMYQKLEQDKKLPFRVIGSVVHNAEIDSVARLEKFSKNFNSELVKVNTLKLFMDGVEANHSAAMLAPYEDKPDEKGKNALSLAQSKDLFQRVDAAGFNIHTHAIGDAAARQALDSIEHIIKTNKPRDRRYAIAHLQAVNAADIPRFRELNVIAQFSAQWAVPDEYYFGVTQKRFGEERAKHLYPIRAILSEGGRISLGTDWPAASYISTFKQLAAIESATTRQELGQPQQAPLPLLKYRLSVPEAIYANTMGSAYQLGMENDIGSIETGKLADLIILDKDILNIDKSEIHQAKVLMTMMNGVIRHEILAKL